MNLINISRHQRQHLQNQSKNLMKPFVAVEYFLSMYSNSVLTKRMMATIRLPKATVPRWYVVAVQREAPRIAKLPGSFFDLLQYLGPLKPV